MRRRFYWRQLLLLVALGLGAIGVLFDAGWLLEEGEYDGVALTLILGALLVAPLAVPLLLMRSRWYRPLTLVIALLAGFAYVGLAIVGGLVLVPAAFVVLLSVLTPQPP